MIEQTGCAGVVVGRGCLGRPWLFTDLVAQITEDVLLIIGPEGGIEENEMQLFSENGALTASLGETILRTSTAGGISAAILLSKTRWIN
jgi:RsmE family RNA methyltransferase